MKNVQARKLRVMLSAIVALSMILAAPVSAAPDHKSFTVERIGDSAINAGVGEIRLLVTNTSANTDLGAIRLTVAPEGMTITDMASPNWVYTASNNQLAANSSQNRLPAGQSMVVTVSVSTVQDDDTLYTISVEGRQANHFNGGGNQVNFTGDEPTVLVKGMGVLCTGTSCSGDYENLSLDLGCKVTDCGVLALDVGPEYCENSDDCVGNQGVFWNPPAGSKDKVKLKFVIHAELSYHDFKNLVFYIDPGTGTFEECSLEGTIECEYTKKRKHYGNKVIIKATVEAADPRGFAS